MENISPGILVITGGSRGIGLATVDRFLAEGWSVLNFSRTPCTRPQVINFSLDLLSLNQETLDGASSNSLQSIFYEKQRIVLVHNAGSFIRDQVGTMDVYATRDLFQINVFAPMILNETLIPFMGEGSAIIYMGSTLSEKAVPHAASYVSAKHAVVGLMKASCQDLAGTGIHTCCICPGVTETEMLKQRLMNDLNLRTSLTELSASGRFVEPAELGELVWFTSQNPVINGAIIHGNLGQIER